MKPNNGQEAAVSGILGVLADKNARQAVLAGYAGTGKTTTLGWIVDAAKESRHSVCVIAHTRKALSEANARLPAGVVTMTVYRALGWTIDPRTQSTIKRGGHRLRGFSLVIVDEASMIDVEMYDAILRAAAQVGAFVLWVGDPAQLPPITPDGLQRMPAFELVEHRHTLTEIMRQAGDSDIVSASMYLRECLELRVRPCVDELAQHTSDGSITVLGGGAVALADYTTSAIQHGLDARVIAWTNAAVNRAASLISAAFHPLGSERIVEGDPVMFARRMSDDIETDTTGVVLSVWEPAAYGPLGITCLMVQVRTPSGVVTKHTPCNLDAFLETRRSLVRELARARRAGDVAITHQTGLALQEVDDTYADLRHQYALTSHKSQGSTFDVAVVDWQDMSACSDTELLCRMLYVACTRPSKFLVIVR